MKIGGEDVNLDFVRGFSALEPFGEGNPVPVFAVKNAAIVDSKVLKGKHVALTLRHGGRQFRAIGFNMAPPRSGTKMLDLALTLAENEWNGEKRVNALIADIRACAA